MSLNLIQIKLQANDPRYLTHHAKWYWVLDHYVVGFGESELFTTEEEAILTMLKGQIKWQHLWSPDSLELPENYNWNETYT